MKVIKWINLQLSYVITFSPPLATAGLLVYFETKYWNKVTTPALLAVFKILKGFQDVRYHIYFTLSQSGLRGHSYKLYKPNSKLDIRKFFFSFHVIIIWNALTYSVFLQCNIVNTFNFQASLGLVTGDIGYSRSQEYVLGALLRPPLPFPPQLFLPTLSFRPFPSSS